MEIIATSNGVIEAREIRPDGFHHRYTVIPGEDFSPYPAEVRAACISAHTPEVIAGYQEYLASFPPLFDFQP